MSKVITTVLALALIACGLAHAEGPPINVKKQEFKVSAKAVRVVGIYFSEGTEACVGIKGKFGSEKLAILVYDADKNLIGKDTSNNPTRTVTFKSMKSQHYTICVVNAGDDDADYLLAWAWK
jgi:hypothetical protein